MIKIAITGNIGSGKSEAEKYLENLKYPVIDTDKITHFLLEKSIEIKEKIKLCFKEFDICDENGGISRKKLGKIVFSDKVLLKKLEGIIHPAVTDEVNKFFEMNKDKDIVFVSIPLLYEVSCPIHFDKVVLIYCDDEIRKKRLIKNRNYSEEEAEKRMNAQLPQKNKVKLADFTLFNNTDLNDLYSQIDNVLQKLSEK